MCGWVLPMTLRYCAERAIAPVDGAVCYLVVDADFVFHVEACAYLAFLRDAGRSPNTARVYAGRIAQFLTYCADNRLDWKTVAIEDLSRFMRFLVSEPLPARSVNSTREPRFRSSRTANAIMTTVSEFLRFAATRGWVDASMADRLSRPRFLRYRARGQSWGEDEQFRTVNSRTLKLPESESPVQSLSSDEITRLLKSTVHQRDLFLIAVLDETGMRIGETLGLRREDMHLLSSSTRLGCSVQGPHLHVRRRVNANGALAKSKFPRSIPVTTGLVELYAVYLHERSGFPDAERCDFVFVNLFKPPVGEPMKYNNAKKLFDRLSGTSGFTARPHMLRHSAASRWLADGAPRDVVQALLGHVSPASMEVYLHPTDAAKRAAVERTGAAIDSSPT